MRANLYPEPFRNYHQTYTRKLHPFLNISLHVAVVVVVLLVVGPAIVVVVVVIKKNSSKRDGNAQSGKGSSDPYGGYSPTNPGTYGGDDTRDGGATFAN